MDEVFEQHRQRQYARELLFSTVVDLMTLVALGLRPSLHAAARAMPELPVSLASLYDKVSHTEPAILSALVRGSAERLAPVVAAIGGEASLPGWRLRILDGNHLSASEKRLAPLRGHRGAALPGQTLVVYDPDSGLVTNIVPSEDAHASERAAVPPLLDRVQPDQLWIADRHFCTSAILRGWEKAGAHFIVREQAITVGQVPAPWRRIEIALDTPTQAGDGVIRLWGNLPKTVEAQRIAALYRRRWRIEGLFQRLESALHSEIASLGHPRAALLGFAAAVLAHNVLALLQRCVEQVHQQTSPALEVSSYHLALQIRSSYDGMLIALPPEHWPSDPADPAVLADHLLRLARAIDPRQVATSKRAPKTKKPKGYVDAAVARAHVATARMLRKARAATTP